MIDGLGDRSTNRQTPLQMADTPNLDWLASQNLFGVHDPV